MLARPSTAELLAADLRRQILDGDPAAGERLRERELVERYGVARHTLRAALRQLAGEGLVTIEPHRGASVTRLGPEEVRGLYELRTALELEAAHLALERHRGRRRRRYTPRSPRSRRPAREPIRRGARSATPTPRCTARSWRRPGARASSRRTRR
jgi:DNA-binding GntR family transcriptional regulator